jgi:8-oxo-dGTP diphosphatase
MNFSITVYGILINEAKQILVSDEYIRGNYFTKFPGGGMEVGEGTRDCLKREFMEELQLKIEVGEHIYTTDFFQQSAFNAAHQIVSIYYWVTPLQNFTTQVKNTPFAYDEQQLANYVHTKQIESCRFVDWNNFSPETVTLPIDKIVAKIIKEKTK